MKDNKILITGIAKNCSNFLPNILKNITSLNQIFTELHFLFVENDSTDNTKEILNNFKNETQNVEIINLDGLDFIKQKTKRIEIARNSYLENLKSDQKFNDFDFLLILDLDDININFDFCSILESISFLKNNETHAAVFPNQLKYYYDLWALRHKTLCPDDIFLDLAKIVYKEKSLNDEIIKNSLIKKIAPLEISPSDKIFEVDSAFGGLGIYKMNYVLNNPIPYIGIKIVKFLDNLNKPIYSQAEICEHISFNNGIKSLGGRLFINPSLINNHKCLRVPLLTAFTKFYKNFNNDFLFKIHKT